MGTMTMVEKLRALGFDGNELGHEAADYIQQLEKYIQNIDGKTVCIRCDGDTFIDDGIVVASDVVRS